MRVVRTEEEVTIYRDAIDVLASQNGQRVPDLRREDGSVDVDGLREWLREMLSGPFSPDDKPRGGQKSGGRGGGGRRGRA